MAVPVPDLTALRRITEQSRPVALSKERTLAVPGAFASLLPQGGLVRGTTVATAGSASSSLALALVGPTTQAGSWCAAVGLDDLGWLAAAELGVDLARALLVADPGPNEWAGTVAALLDAVEVVLVRPTGRVTPSVQRRLQARARDRGSVLLQVGGRIEAWAAAPDLTVTATSARWEGVGSGHGRLRARRVAVSVTGRRGAVRARTAELWLPGPDGRLAVADPVAEVAASPTPTLGASAPLREVG